MILIDWIEIKHKNDFIAVLKEISITVNEFPHMLAFACITKTSAWLFCVITFHPQGCCYL